MVEWLNPQPGWQVLDVAGGTGDIAFRIAEMARAAGRRGRRSPSATSMPTMLGEGVRRAEEKGESAIDWVVRRCREACRSRTRSFDAYTIAFGIRNVTHIDKALREARRVLKPGGRFLCLEFSKVEVPGLDTLYDAYSFKLLPKLGRLVAGDDESYRYLAESIRRFPPQAKFASMIERGGPGAGQGAQSDRRHRRHAFGLADLMDGDFQLLCVCGRPALRVDALLPDSRAGALRAAGRGARAPGARLARALERLGPAYIKLGQMLATRPDIVGDEVARGAGASAGPLAAFSRCRGARRDRRQSSASRWRRCSPAFGAPVAAASIAQVHRAMTTRQAADARGGQGAAPRHRERCSRRDLDALALFARAGRALLGGSAAAALDRAGGDAGGVGGAGTRSAHGSGGGLRTV